jgi:hypothetical protein
MARMHLEDIEALEKATPGERTVFRFLRIRQPLSPTPSERFPVFPGAGQA